MTPDPAQRPATRGTAIPHSGEVARDDPFCGGESLFLAAGGYVTCSRLDCPNPTLTSDCLGARQKIVAGPVTCPKCDSPGPRRAFCNDVWHEAVARD